MNSSQEIQELSNELLGQGFTLISIDWLCVECGQTIGTNVNGCQICAEENDIAALQAANLGM